MYTLLIQNSKFTLLYRQSTYIFVSPSDKCAVCRSLWINGLDVNVNVRQSSGGGGPLHGGQAGGGPTGRRAGGGSSERA